MVNKTVPNNVSVKDYVASIGGQRNSDATTLIELMSKISGLEPVLWGPSIIGFGTKHYKYDTGREGDMPILSFSPRKSKITVYFNEGFDRYHKQLKVLGKYEVSVSCLYFNNLKDIDLKILTDMLKISFSVNNVPNPITIDQYLESIPLISKTKINELRALIKTITPNANEVVSYGVIGYKIDKKRARVFIAGWKDHVSIYPVPKEPSLQSKIKPFIKSKGTLWFDINKPLPTELIKEIVHSLTN